MTSNEEPDLFTPPSAEAEPPSESVYADNGEEELAYIGEVQMPKPVPTELVVEVQGWDYYYKLDRRSKS